MIWVVMMEGLHLHYMYDMGYSMNKDFYELDWVTCFTLSTWQAYNAMNYEIWKACEPMIIMSSWYVFHKIWLYTKWCFEVGAQLTGSLYKLLVS